MVEAVIAPPPCNDCGAADSAFLPPSTTGGEKDSVAPPPSTNMALKDSMESCGCCSSFHNRRC